MTVIRDGDQNSLITTSLAKNMQLANYEQLNTNLDIQNETRLLRSITRAPQGENDGLRGELGCVEKPKLKIGKSPGKCHIPGYMGKLFKCT